MLKTSMKKKILLAHSPDADDAFMFYALAANIIQNDKIEIEHILKDIQTLNSESEELKYDVQAISFFTYPEIEHNYQLLSCGGSVGHGYGPLVVSKEEISFDDLKKNKDLVIAVPGEKTTAFLLLKLLLKDFKYIVVPFDQVLDYVSSGKASCGLVIHEGQLSYSSRGLKKVIDLGEWFLGKTNLPVPLGGNVIKRAFDEKEKKEINQLIKQSIVYALENKDQVVSKVSKYARELSENHAETNKFVSMYVNSFTVDYGDTGKLAIKKLFEMAVSDGLISKMPTLDFV